MLAWKLFASVGVVLIGAGITATAVVQKAGFACVVPWYKDASCGIPNLTLPPETELRIEIVAVTKDGKKYNDTCPVIRFYDAKNDKELRKPCDISCDGALCSYDNASKVTSQVVYVRFSGGSGQEGSIDVRGTFKLLQ